MSHFTKVQTKITDFDCLKQALEDLQYTCQEGEVRVRGWRGQWSEADLVVDTGGPYNIGFRKASQGNYEVVADWWGVEMRQAFPRRNSSMTCISGMRIIRCFRRFVNEASRWRKMKPSRTILSAWWYANGLKTRDGNRDRSRW